MTLLLDDACGLLIGIGTMLKEDPRNRPNIYEVVREVCKMQGKDVPITDVCRSPLLWRRFDTDCSLDILQPLSFRSAQKPRTTPYPNRSSCARRKVLATSAGNGDYSRNRAYAPWTTRKITGI